METYIIKFAKLTAVLLIFLFLLTPLAPVLAVEHAPVETPAPAIPKPEVPAPSDTAPQNPDTPPAADPNLPDEANSKAEEATDKPKDNPKDKDGDPTEEPAPESLSATAPVASSITTGLPPSTIRQGLPEANELYGSLNYNYPLTIPPGRNGMQPDLALTYNSSANEEEAIIGSGWSVNIPSIVRINRKGTDKLYTENYFYSSLNGELVNTTGTTYKAKVDNGEFLTYTLSSNVWTVKDKKGTVYKFGTNAAERQDNSADTSKVYKWMLQEVRDLNDNYIKYEYYKDAGQIYPSKIKYTGYDTTDGIFEIEFLRESRSDTTVNYRSGFSVTTSYRIYEIQAKISGTWARKYALTFTTARNGRKSLLNTITESGQDESANTVSLPVQDFDYQTGTNTFSSGSWSSPVDLTKGVIIADVNGDGLPDLLQHHVNGGTTLRAAYINTGSSFSANTGWDPPSAMPFYTVGTGDNGVRAVDINGDAKTDLVQSEPGNKRVYLNSGSGWTLDTDWDSWSSSFDFVENSQRTDTGSRLVDVNGDGLPDFIKGRTNPSTGIVETWLALHNGTGWTQILSGDPWSTSTPWAIPVDLRWGTILADFNADGLMDLLHHQAVGEGSERVAYINNGNGWVESSAFIPPSDMLFYKNSDTDQDKGVRGADINADGLTDLIQSNANYKRAFINNGAGWTEDANWDDWPSGLKFIESNGSDGATRTVDLNGDGIVDLFKAISGGGGINTDSSMNTGTTGDLMNKITYPRAGYTDITYKATPLYTSGGSLLNPNLPYVLDTVYQLVNNDGLSGTSTYTHSYEGGAFYFNNIFDRRFAGFNKIKKTNAASHVTSNFYHQGNTTDSSNGEYSDHGSKIGKIYRTEVADSSSNIYTKVINKWENYSPDTGRDFVKLTQSIGMSYDGDSDHKDKAVAYTYSDTNGNLTQQVEWGEVTGADAGTFTDTSSDKYTTDITYASNTTLNILGLPKQETTIDQSSNKVRESKYYYDSEAHGDVTKGNLTKEERWKSGTTYIDFEKTYNSYGLVATEKDPRDKTTTYIYDTNNLYPATVTNPLTQATSYTYDYSLGKPKQVTDPNTRVFQIVYDGLDRVTEEKQPDLTTPSTLVTKTTYTYTSQTVGNKIQRTDNLDGTITVDTYVYTDGFDRVIQKRAEAEDANTFSVTDTIYNNIEQVNKESLPYFSTGSAKTAATTTTALLIIYSYDPMLRISSTVNAAGTTSNAYDDWKLSITDPRSKLKHLYKDAYGNLIKVDETNSASTYTTNYEYNGNNNLTKITDALGNVRNFTYDGLGRRLTAQDLHASADTTYGSWTYTYEDSGNLTSVTDPKSQQIDYTYDDVNRRLTENYTGQTGTEVSYTYDSGTDGVGRLTSVTAAGANSSYVYNPHGRVKQETKTINSTNYQTDYSLDRQGNILEITNPDSSKVKYTYNTAGQVETVQRKESTDGGFINLITDFDYGAHGKVINQTNANSTTTVNTYDDTKLYRLQRRQTIGGAGVSTETSTFYPDASAIDGRVQHYGGNVPWSDLVNGAGNGRNYTDWLVEMNFRSGTSSGQWQFITRGIALFDTSSIPDTTTITSATLSLYGYAKTDNLNTSPDINIYSSNPASNTALVGADYSTVGSTAFSTAISYSSWVIEGYNNFALNANGLASISKNDFPIPICIGLDELICYFLHSSSHLVLLMNRRLIRRWRLASGGHTHFVAHIEARPRGICTPILGGASP